MNIFLSLEIGNHPSFTTSCKQLLKTCSDVLTRKALKLWFCGKNPYDWCTMVCQHCTTAVNRPRQAFQYQPPDIGLRGCLKREKEGGLASNALFIFILIWESKSLFPLLAAFLRVSFKALTPLWSCRSNRRDAITIGKNLLECIREVTNQCTNWSFSTSFVNPLCFFWHLLRQY